MEECTQKSRVIGLACEGETKWIIRKLTDGPAEVDISSIVSMPRLGKTTLMEHYLLLHPTLEHTPHIRSPKFWPGPVSSIEECTQTSRYMESTVLLPQPHNW
ncbi:hypothetical protein H5410_028611 [Solanum commersonii]|uniref:Uncharacterized protein n=1 Tax=Solanum commersonii TaxID=4109 RepID=A0A9J5Z5E5_SOLCO|nr:hypothetical protein H5410_028611 [Solanum commersonii]